MKRNYCSGSEKRKKSKIKNEQEAKQKDALLLFLKPKNETEETLHLPSETSDCQNEVSKDAYSHRPNILPTVVGSSEATNISNNDDKKNTGIATELHCGIEHFPIDTPSTSNSMNSRPSLFSISHVGVKQSRITEIENSSATELIVGLDNTTIQSPTEECNILTTYEPDIALWPQNLTQDMVEYYLINKPKSVGDLRLLKKEYFDSGRQYYRNLNENHFYRVKKNGAKEPREWLVFSETSKCAYCYVCKLFPDPKKNKCSFVDGFSNWASVSRLLEEHENSKMHATAMFAFITRCNSKNRIDTHLATQIEKECTYWRLLLHRVVATVKLLAKLGLPFRGHTETAKSQGKGNFLTSLEYLAEFDDFIKNHLNKHLSCGSGRTNYLSHQTYDEILLLMADQVQTSFVKEIKDSIYFSIIVDSTPDISHVDQLTVVLRYVNSHGDIVERFLCFTPLQCHKSEHLEQTILEKLKDLGLDIKNCRGQSYDTAANMSGQYTGLQARIKEHSPTALYVPCSSHSLNLIGNSAAECCQSTVRYFDFVQKIYTFFSGSTHRWQILKQILDSKTTGNKQQKTVKKLSDTRWSARADAVLALKENYNEIKNALLKISISSDDKPSTKHEAKSLAKHFEKYENAVLTIFWDRLLQRLNKVSKSLQSQDGTVVSAVNLLNTLTPFVNKVRNDFCSVEKQAMTLSNCGLETEHGITKRTSVRKPFFDEDTTNETVLEGSQKFLVETYYPVCDQLIVQLEQRSKMTKEIFDLFKCIIPNPAEEDDSNLDSNDIAKLVEMYFDDIDTNYFEDELRHFLYLVKEDEKSKCSTVDNQNKQIKGTNLKNNNPGDGEDREDSLPDKFKSPTELYKLINNGLSATFPNVKTILQIFMTLPISNASGERSFSALKRVKSFLRSALSQEHLNALAILYIEKAALSEINYDSLIDNFVKNKCRKKFI